MSYLLADLVIQILGNALRKSRTCWRKRCCLRAVPAAEKVDEVAGVYAEGFYIRAAADSVANATGESPSRFDKHRQFIREVFLDELALTIHPRVPSLRPRADDTSSAAAQWPYRVVHRSL